MRFRLYVFKDPEEKTRGYSLKGLKLPLTTFCPVKASPNLLGYDDKPVYGRYEEYWKIPVSILILIKPELKRHLKGIDYFLIPTEWCDVHPIFSELK